MGSACTTRDADGAPDARSDEETEDLGEGARPTRVGARAPRIKDFAGSVSFLPAYPVDLGNTEKSLKLPGLPLEDVPQLGELELDVVTIHHKQYYTEPNRQEKPRE